MPTPWPFVTALVVREEMASTSDLARELVADPGHALPFAVRALRQTRGRGRGANSWWSDEGSLTVTVAIDPAAHGLESRHEPMTALAVAVAVIDAVGGVAGVATPLGIRWPNDVEAGGRKVAGILPERVETPNGPRLLIGLGVNVTTRLDAAPSEVRRMAVSLQELRHESVPVASIDDVLRAILERLPAVIEALAREDARLAERWAALDTLGGTSIRVDLGASIVTGVARGIDVEGAILIDTAEARLRLFGGQVLRDAGTR